MASESVFSSVLEEVVGSVDGRRVLGLGQGDGSSLIYVDLEGGKINYFIANAGTGMKTFEHNRPSPSWARLTRYICSSAEQATKVRSEIITV